MCTNEKSARLNKPMKQKKKPSNTCTLSVYTDLDELRLWSVVFIIQLVGASERGKKNHFFRLLLFQKPQNNTQDNVYICTKLLIWMTKKKPLRILCQPQKKVYLHVQLIYN